MNLTSPKLTLTFLGNDLPAGRSASQVITDEYIIKNSMTLNKTLMSGLRSASNQMSLSLSKNCASVEDIIATDGDIKAVLSDGLTTLFTGYISTSFSWKVTQNGEQVLGITLEDTSTRLLTKPFIETGYHLFNSTAADAIEDICEAACIAISSSTVAITDRIVYVAEAGQSCKELLDQMLYELGYVYYCDNLGELRFFKVDVASLSNLPTLDKDDLYDRNGNVVTLSKKIRQYRSVRMTYKAIGTANNYLVYRNTTGADDAHPYCNMELQSGEHFDGLEIYTAQEWSEATADEFREPALIEACNAASETELVGSNKIISISELRSDVDKGQHITISMTHAGGPYIEINAENTGFSAESINRMDLFASILYEKSQNIVRTGISGGSTDSLYTEDCEFIHTKALMTKHANLVCQYNAYCNSKYTFFSDADLNCGSLIHLSENVFSGLAVDVMIIGKTETDKSSIKQYTAIGVSVFSLDDDVFHRDTDTGKANTKGEKGTGSQWKEGNVLVGTTYARGVVGNEGDYYLNKETFNIYRCIVSGGTNTALWQYTGNIKGKDYNVTGYTYEIEYGLSTSPTGFIYVDTTLGYDSSNAYGYQQDREYGFYNYGWGPTVDGWYHGLYVWTRIKITDADGNITYEDPTYAAELTQSLIDSCTISLASLPDAYTSNMRRPNSQYLFLSIRDVGYRGTLNIHTDTGVFASYNATTGQWTDLTNALKVTLSGTSIVSNYGIKLPYAMENNVTIEGEFEEWTLDEFSVPNLSICPSIEKTVAVQLDTVNTYADLPSLVNKSSQDANIDDRLIKGDYILVKFLTLTATSTTQATDETGKLWNITELSSYYDSNLDPITVSAFVVDTTYYAFAIYAWMHDGTQWTRNPSAAVEINTVKEAVDLAQIQHDIDPTVDYHRCLYAHQILVEKLTAGVINVGNIFVNDVESTNYSEDADGNPITGYKLEHEEGIIKAVNAKFVNADITGDTRIGERAIVQGVIQNIDENGEMAFETVKNEGETATYTASKEDGVDAPNAYSKSEWLAHLTSFINSSLTNKSVYAIDSCKLNDADNNTVTNLDSIVRFSSVSGATSTFIDSTGGTEQETKRVWTNPYSTEITLSSLSVKEKTNSFMNFSFGSGYSLVVYYSNGSVKSTLFNVAARGTVGQGELSARRDSTSNVVIPPKGYVNVIWNSYSGISDVQEAGYAYVSYNESANFSVGIYVFRNGVKYQLPSFLGNTGFSTLDGTTITIHGFSAKTLNFTANANWPSGVNKYYAFTWTVAPTNPTEVITSLLEDSSYFYYVDNAVPIGYVRYSATSLSIASTDETVYVLTGTFVREHIVRLDVKANVVGVRTQNLMPVYKDGERIGDGIIGSAQEPFHQIYSDLVNGIVVGTSTRDKKTNIHIYEGNALDILKRVTVKQFNYKFEIDAERCYTHYGFIAEETPEELATPYHDVMEEQSCIGILIKAVQELSAEINRLKGGN